jgi:PAS domain S-box-containing protein
MSIRQYQLRIYLLCILMAGTLAAHAQKENMETLFDIHHLLAYLVAAFFISVFVMLFLNRVFYYREKDARRQSNRLNTQLSMILNSSKTQTWTYDIERELYTVVSEENTTETKYTSFDFSQFYDRNDFQELRKAIMIISKGKKQSETIDVKGSLPKNPRERQRIYEINVSVLRSDRRNNPTILLGIQHDITGEKEKMEKAQSLTLRYHTVFDSSQVDMVYYDADGYLSDINEKACETFQINDRDALLRSRVHYKDIPVLADLDFQHIDSCQMSVISDFNQVKSASEHLQKPNNGKKLYYEMNVSTIRDEQGQVQGLVIAGRDITEMVESNHHQQEVGRQLDKTTKEIKAYINNINYSLKVSDVRLMSYHPEVHELEISSDLNKTQYKMTPLRAVSLLKESERRRVKGLFRRMDNYQKEVFSDTFCTIMRDNKGRNIYLNFHVMPIYNKDGRITHYFGMCRNETEMTYTERRLQEETAKAQETEQLKSSFLLNMSYELRTPLNAVVGFAELYNAEHNPEDEPIFAEEIKTNTNVLLALINDILFISRLDAHMIEFNYQPCDFAMLFDGWCYMGWSTLGPNVKTVVENPYTKLDVKIDQQNLGMVIQKLCVHSANSIQEGMVRAKYEYRHGELMITIEDTGRGLTPEARARIFDRFSREAREERQGTGLDLPIVKELLDQMGGNIELQSESGKGTVFYVSIPCEMISLEKKSEIIA